MHRCNSAAIDNDSATRIQKLPRQPTVSAAKVPSGTPNTSAALIPKYTLDTPLPSLPGPANCPAVSLAVPQNTGRPSAGMNRANASTQMLVATAASALDAANTSKMTINSFLRSR